MITTLPILCENKERCNEKALFDIQILNFESLDGINGVYCLDHYREVLIELSSKEK